MQTSKQSLWKGYHLSIGGIRKGYLFREKWYIKRKGFDFEVEPPRINTCSVHPPPSRKQSPCVELWGIWNGFWGGHGCYRNIMLPGRPIYRLKLSHKSLCHWLLCFDCILLVRWWCQVRTIIMLVMYFVIASAWCIMEATMHTAYFSGQRLSTDPFLTLKFILFYIVYGSQF